MPGESEILEQLSQSIIHDNAAGIRLALDSLPTPRKRLEALSAADTFQHKIRSDSAGNYEVLHNGNWPFTSEQTTAILPVCLFINDGKCP